MTQLSQPNLDPLAQLNDIIPAEAISWWPLAVGWWVLIGLSILLTALLVSTLIKYYRKYRWRREALELLSEIEQRYFLQFDASDSGDSQYNDSQSNCSRVNNPRVDGELNRLLKQIVSSASTQLDVRAKATGEWQSIIKQRIPVLSLREVEIITTGHYQASAPRLSRETFTALKQWLKAYK